eukprot:Gregarina_sp_Pseudo_9__2277@NODE_2601_length_940_cov_2274_917869_g2385_i0_p2_GENE_NODE_2601_length_940_cov_2274_917869_g2385_i0NODE_2601_length_940_cov_2274_917869_g2385_i0_p2_ORF_typecomplete_len111_score7_58_NODE_2601_length_940_cov_2274_917869_g2385_i0541873
MSSMGLRSPYTSISVFASPETATKASILENFIFKARLLPSFILNKNLAHWIGDALSPIWSRRGTFHFGVLENKALHKPNSDLPTHNPQVISRRLVAFEKLFRRRARVGLK